MAWKPNKWLALVLGFLLPPAAFLYVGRWILALSYLGVGVAGALLDLYLRGPGYFSLALNFLCAAVAYWLASSAAPVAHRVWYGRWQGIAGLFAGAFALIALLRAFVAEPFRTPSSAMEPALPLGSIFLVSKLGYSNIIIYGVSLRRGPPIKNMTRGSVVLFEAPGRTSQQFAKRLVGLPGDVLEYKDKALSINGIPVGHEQERLDQSRVRVTEEVDGVSFKAVIDNSSPATDWKTLVPPGHYFVLGDNRDLSSDSRHFGPVREETLIGEVFLVF